MLGYGAQEFRPPLTADNGLTGAGCKERGGLLTATRARAVHGNQKRAPRQGRFETGCLLRRNSDALEQGGNAAGRGSSGVFGKSPQDRPGAEQWGVTWNGDRAGAAECAQSRSGKCSGSQSVVGSGRRGSARRPKDADAAVMKPRTAQSTDGGIGTGEVREHRNYSFKAHQYFTVESAIRVPTATSSG